MRFAVTLSLLKLWVRPEGPDLGLGGDQHSATAHQRPAMRELYLGNSQPMVDLPEAMTRLTKLRSIFHSEADFQHALAWLLHEMVPSLKVRLEHPAPWGKGAVDILARAKGCELAIEVKYLCRRLETTIDGEAFLLKQHSAHDVRSYDVCRDIERMERFVSERPGAHAAVIVLSNDHTYWAGPRSDNTCYADFALRDGRSLTGSLSWSERTGAGTMRGRAQAIELQGKYHIRWQDYSCMQEPSGRFQFLYIAIPPKIHSTG